MTYVVGLTGGIGSGKSTVSDLFAALGVPVIDADKIARDLLAPNTAAFKAVVTHFGSHFLHPSGELDRTALREAVFHDLNEKKWLESLLHPLIYHSIVTQLKHINSPYCILSIPLLAEHYTTYKALLDYVIVIDLDPEVQIQRSTAREGSSLELLKKMIATQANRSERLDIADHVIQNSGSVEDLAEKVKELNNFILGGRYGTTT